jgi:hypothetical protein
MVLIQKLKKMSLNDIKIYSLNLTTLGISLTSIDIALKIILVSVSILYTLHKWYLMYEKNRKK